MNTDSPHYRAEIDGMRALAVLAVLFYHIGSLVPVGFLGVDMFFVISGYVVFLSCRRAIQEERFSVANFWRQRIRRLLPSLLAVIVFTLILTPFVMTAAWYQDTCNTAMSSILGTMNVYLWFFTQDYFHTVAELKPLLHIWSLSVEEQFYLIAPFVGLAFIKIRARWRVISFLLLGCFGLFLAMLWINESASFFLLPFRAWQLILGVVIAKLSLSFPLSKTAALWVSVAAVTAILASFFLRCHSVFSVVMCSMGSAALLFGVVGQQHVVQRMFSLKPLMCIGLVSYSLYLWHWPFCALAKHLFAYPDMLHVQFAVLVISCISAFVSYRLIESPARYNPKLTAFFGSFKFLAIAILLTALTALTGRHLVDETVKVEGKGWGSTVSKKFDYKDPRKGVDIGMVELDSYHFALWGDSHATAVASSLNNAAQEEGIKGGSFSRYARPAIVGDVEKCARFDETVIETLITKRVRNVILVNRWTNYLTGENVKEVSKRFKRVVNRLNQHGIKVHLLRTVPEVPFESPDVTLNIIRKFPLLNAGATDHGESIKVHEKRVEREVEFLAMISSLDVNIIDVTPHFYNNPSKTLQWFGDQSFYRDDDHVSDAGAERLIVPTIIDRIKSSQK